MEWRAEREGRKAKVEGEKSRWRRLEGFRMHRIKIQERAKKIDEREKRGQVAR